LYAEQQIAADLRHQHEDASGQAAEQIKLLQAQLNAEQEAHSELHRRHQQTLQEAGSLQVANADLFARLEQTGSLVAEAIATRDLACSHLTEVELAATAQQHEIDRLRTIILELKSGARRFEERYDELAREHERSTAVHQEHVAILKLELASFEATSALEIQSVQHQRDEARLMLAEREAELLTVARRLDAERAANLDLLTSSTLATSQHQEELAALVDAFRAQTATMAASEANAAAQIEALVAELQLERLEAQGASENSSSLIVELKAIIANQERLSNQAEQLFAARANEISSQYSQRLREAEEALSVLDYDRTQKAELSARLQLEVDRLQTALYAAEAAISAARQDAEQAQALSSSFAARSLQLREELASEIALLKEQAKSERAALDRAEQQFAEACAGEKRLAAIVTEQDNALKSLAGEYAESRQQFAGIVQALEGDLKNVMAELSARDTLLASATRREPSAPTVDEAVEIVLQHIERNGAESAPAIMSRLAKIDAASMPAINSVDAVIPSDARLEASPEAEALRHWRMGAEGELQRLRADRVRIEDELDRANQQLESIGRSLRKSLYWRTRSKTARIMFSQKSGKAAKARTERSTWPDD
jgi:hypothetical protein